MKRGKAISMTAGAAMIAVVAAGAVSEPPMPEWTSVLADYPARAIEAIPQEERPPELVRFIETQAALAVEWNDPETRLRVDPRQRGIKDRGPYRVRVDAVKDGDTVEVTFQSGMCGWLPCPNSKADIRIWGLDSGETRSGAGQSNADCDAERRAGEAAKVFAERELMGAERVYAYNLRPDPYANRWVATLAYFPPLSEAEAEAASKKAQERFGEPPGSAGIRFYHIEALRFVNRDGSNVFAFYDPIANQVLGEGGSTGFGKRKIWCNEEAGGDE